MDGQPNEDGGIDLRKTIFGTIVISAVAVLLAWPASASRDPMPRRSGDYAGMDAGASANSGTQSVVAANPSPTPIWQVEDMPFSSFIDRFPRRGLVFDDNDIAYVLGEYEGSIDDPAPELSDVRFAYRLADGTWETPVTIDVRHQACGNCHSSSPASPLALAVDRTGSAHAVWMDSSFRRNSEYSLPQYSSRPAGGTWTVPANIFKGAGTEDYSEATAPEVMVDPDGNTRVHSRKMLPKVYCSLK